MKGLVRTRRDREELGQLGLGVCAAGLRHGEGGAHATRPPLEAGGLKLRKGPWSDSKIDKWDTDVHFEPVICMRA